MNTAHAVELCDHEGTWLRTCPRGALEALDAVRRQHASVADVILDQDRCGITVVYGGRRYGYQLLPVVMCSERVDVAGQAA